QPIDAIPIVYVASGFCQNIVGNQSSRPRPKPPLLVGPPATPALPSTQPITLRWTGETDPVRATANGAWPIVYDLFTSVNGAAETSLASNLPASTTCSGTPLTCSRTVPAGTFPAGASVSWRVLAKMDTKVLPAPNNYYTTSSAKFPFSTTLPDDFSI